MRVDSQSFTLATMTDAGEDIHVDLRSEQGPSSSAPRFRLPPPSPLFSEPPVSARLVLALRIINVAAFVACCVVNGLGASGAIGNGSQGELSDKYPTPITPAGYAFSIWSLIYLFQAVLFLVYQFLPSANKGLVFRRLAFWPAGLAALNIAWIFAFSYESMVLQCVVIFGMLGCLSAMYARIHTASDLSAGTRKARETRSWVEYFCVYVPWSLYTSWVLGASLISIFIASGRAPEDSVYGGMAALAFAAFANVMVLAWARDPWFAGVNVWTLVAIFNNQSELPLIWGSAITLAGVVGACTAVTWALNALALLPSIRRSSAAGSDKGSLHDAMLDS